jgi:hypothetical protein
MATIGEGFASGALVVDQNAFTDATKSVTSWPVWLIVVCSLGGALFFFLLFIMCMCISASTRTKKEARKTSTMGAYGRQDPDYGDRLSL